MSERKILATLFAAAAAGCCAGLYTKDAYAGATLFCTLLTIVVGLKWYDKNVDDK